MNKIFTSLLLPLFILIALFMISSSAGRNDLRANAPGDPSGCEGCHSGGTGSVTGTLSGVPSIILPGSTYTLTLSAGDFGSGEVAGFQIAASSGASFPSNLGTFTASSGTRVNPAGRLVQSTPLAYSGGVASWTFDWTAPTENTYSEVTFFYSINSADDTGGTGGDVTFSGNSANIPVPVTWAYTRVESSEKMNSVYWGTHSEENTAVFEVEHSFDGVQFSLLESIDAAFYSRTDQHYQFDDERSLTGQSFYRIKQIDLDGNFAYSDIMQVDNKADNFQVYPTIFSDILNVKGSFEEGKIVIYDFEGRMVNRQSLQEQLNVSDLTAGNYLLHIEDNYGRLVDSHKLIKL